MMKQLLIISLIFSFYFSSPLLAQKVHVCGFAGSNSLDPEYEISFLANENIPSGTTIYIGAGAASSFDNRGVYDPDIDAFSAGSTFDSRLKYTTTGTINKGDVVKIIQTGSTTFSAVCTQGFDCGQVVFIGPGSSFYVDGQAGVITLYEDDDDDPENGITDLHSVLYIQSFSNIDPAPDYPDASYIGYFRSNPGSVFGNVVYKGEFNVAKRSADTKTSDIEDVVSNWVIPSELSTEAFNDCDFESDFEAAILDTEKGVDGSNLYVIEICGGSPPYELSLDNETPENFAIVDMYPGSSINCRKLRIFYADGAQWRATISDNNECTSGFSISYLNVANEEEMTIMDFTSTQESKAGYSDGTARVEIEGGNDPYGVYTYEWRGPLNTITVTDGSDGNEQTGLSAGIYTVIVTDAANNSQTISGVVKRNRWGGMGRGRSGKTALAEGGELFLGVAPNPFEDYSTVQFQTPVEESISIDVFSLSGQHVANLFEGQTKSDSLQSVPFDRGSLQAGTYIVRLVSDSGIIQHQKVVVM